MILVCWYCACFWWYLLTRNNILINMEMIDSIDIQPQITCIQFIWFERWSKDQYWLKISKIVFVDATLCVEKHFNYCFDNVRSETHFKTIIFELIYLFIFWRKWFPYFNFSIGWKMRNFLPTKWWWNLNWHKFTTMFIDSSLKVHTISHQSNSYIYLFVTIFFFLLNRLSFSLNI